MSDSNTSDFRKATPAEVATVVKMFRKMRGWSQDTLATLARLEVRTIQRVERGERSSIDTKRAICGAFGLEDLDAFNRFAEMPTPEEAESQGKEFDRTHVLLDLVPADGRSIVAMLLELSDYGALGHQGLSEMDAAAQDAFAFILDFARDCMDVRDVAPKSEMLAYGDELQPSVDALAKAGHSLFAARRTAAVIARDGRDAPSAPLPMEILYLVTAPVGVVPGKIAVPRETRGGF